MTIGDISLGGFYFNGEHYTKSTRLANVITITTPYGIKYTFDLHEIIWPVSDSHFSCGSTITIGLDASSTYLKEIEDLSTKRKISFEYEEFRISNYSVTNNEYFLGDITGASFPDGNGNSLIPCLEKDKTTLHYEKNFRIKKITFPAGECSFLYDIERQDVPGDFCLTGLVINDLNGRTIRNNKFSYGYLNSFENCSEPECKRLSITLGHEMAHGLANVQGAKFKDWTTIPTASGDRTLSQSEIYATHVENNLRGERGMPLRTHYSQDQDGNSVNETRILDNRGRSLYYNSGNTSPGGNSYPKTVPSDNRYLYRKPKSK